MNWLPMFLITEKYRRMSSETEHCFFLPLNRIQDEKYAVKVETGEARYFLMEPRRGMTIVTMIRFNDNDNNNHGRNHNHSNRKPYKIDQ